MATHSLLEQAGGSDGKMNIHAFDAEDQDPGLLAGQRCCSLPVAVVLIPFSLAAMASPAVIVGGSKLLSSVAGASFSCAIINAVGISSTAFGCIFFLLAIVLIACGLANSWVRRATIFSRASSRCASAVRFGLCFALLVTVLVLLAAMILGTFLLYGLSLTEPSLSKNSSGVSGISGTVSISRDAHGLTHIIADDKYDALFGQGYAQAQDRLWQMEFQRLAAKGVLAAHVGKAGLKFDKQTRTLGFLPSAEKLCASLTESQAAIFSAFTAGINYYLRSNSERPPEFLFMSRRLFYFHEPEPYGVLDVCLAVRLLQWRLGFNINREISRFNVFWKTSRTYEQTQELFLNQTNITGTILTPEQLNISDADATEARAREAQDFEVERILYDTYMTELRDQLKDSSRRLRGSPADSEASAGGDDEETTGGVFDELLRKLDIVNMISDEASNAWAARAAGSNTACGASDPHLVVNLPSVWYYQHLRWRDFDTAGVGMLGIPGVHIGKTTHVSWGITMSLTDLADLFVLVPDQAAPDTHYIHNGRSIAYTMREEVIHIRGGASYTLRVRESLYGPVATDALSLPPGLHIAVWAQALRPDNTSLLAIENFVSENITSAQLLRDEVFANMRAPGFSIPIADRHGALAYCITGAHVSRARGHTGTMPTLGNGSFDGAIDIPYDELPTALFTADPSVGVAISCANQKIYPDGYRYSLGYDYVYPWRGRRIQSLLAEAPERWSDISFHQRIQLDVRSNMWVTAFSPLLARGTNIVPGIGDFASLLTRAGVEWLDNLFAWDGLASLGATEPTFFWWWARELSAAPQDALEATETTFWQFAYAYRQLANPTPSMAASCERRIEQLHLVPIPQAGGNVSAMVPPCFAFAAAVFDALASEHSPASFGTKWGYDVNRLYATHLMLHGTPFACMFERKVPKDGDRSAVNVANSDLTGSIDVDSASSMRQLYDWADPSTVLFALPGGESGNPYSWRFQNLLTLFSRDEYIAVTVVNSSEMPVNTSSHQTLTP